MERQKRTWNTLFSWICRISMLLLTVSSTEPKITGCELLEHQYMTCYWTGNISDDVTYMMRVKTTNCLCNCSISTNCQIAMDSCNTTTTHCSVKIGSVSHCFSVDVLVFGSPITTSLEEYCFRGINEVKMNPPKITKLAMLPGNAMCLRLEWTDPLSKYLPSERNDRVIQIEYRTPQQAHFPNVNAVLHDWWTNLCGLYPGTKHLVRVRAQDLRAAHHWSSWSGFAEATTAEAAPVSAPELWRHIKPVDRSDQRRITLLWKPLQWPHANGVILRYAASCRDEQHRSSRDCDHLDSQSTSCVISVSPHACTCSLSASNSAGTSPSAHIYIPGEEDTELGPPENISIVALDDFQLEVKWTATVKQSESSFVVEWFPVPDTTVVGLSWRILNCSAKSFIITGVRPEIPYNVSVRVLHNNTAGAARFVIAFTRQGAPSVGPKLEVIQPSRNDMTLKWQPVPLEKLRGFIQNYTIFYKYNGKIKSQVLSGDSEQFSLNALSPGEYAVCVKAHTLAGGAESPWVTVTIGIVHVPVTAIVLCTAVTLILVIFLSQTKRIQQCLCPIVPDPSKSSLSVWPPVCPHQHNLPNMDFKSSPLLFKPISTRGEITGHCRHQHQHHPKGSNLQAFGSETNKQLRKQVSRTFSEPNVEEPTEELTIDLGYQNALSATPRSSNNVSSDCLEGPDVGTTEVDSVFSKGNIVPCSEPYLPLDCPALREDTLDPEDFFYERKLVFKLCPKTCCYSHVSTSYLPDADPYVDFRTVAYNSTNLIRESNHFSRLESSCCSHVLTGYLPVPEPSLDYADFVSVNTTDFLYQSNHVPKYLARGYVHVSTSYLPLPLAHSEADFTNSVHDNNYKSGLNSCIYSNVQTSYQKSCPDLETDDVYRAL